MDRFIFRLSTFILLTIVLVHGFLQVNLSSVQAQTIILYENDFEAPVGAPLAVTCGQNLNATNVNTLYGQPGFTFQQINTVETVIVTAPGYTDSTGQGGNYAIGMLATIQDDRVSLTLDAQSLDFINLQMDVSPISPQGCGVTGGTTAPTFRVNVYDAPAGVFNINAPGVLLDTVDLTGINSPVNTTFAWSTVLGSLDISAATTNFVAVHWDLLNPGPEYAVFDNLTITSSNTAGALGQELGITKSNNVGGVSPDGTWTWALTATNTGIADAVFSNGELILSDTMPAGLTYGSAQITSTANLIESVPGALNCVVNTNILTCSALPGEDVTFSKAVGTFSVSVNVTNGANGTTYINPDGGLCSIDPNNLVIEQDDTNNDCPANNVIVTVPTSGGTGSTTTGGGSTGGGGSSAPSVAAASSFRDTDFIIKTVDKSLAQIGDTLTYSIIFTNPKGNTLGNVVITDAFDSRLQNIRVISNSLGTATVSGNTVTVQGFELVPGQRVTLTVAATISSRANPGDVISNTATLESPDASIHVSNTVQTVILPGSLPATGERNRENYLLWLLPLMIALAGGYLIRQRYAH